MYLNKEKKSKIIAEQSGNGNNSGTPEAQIAIFTHRINHLTGHLSSNKKDFATQRSLTNLVGKRKDLLNYVKDNDLEKYRELVKKLELRK